MSGGGRGSEKDGKLVELEYRPPQAASALKLTVQGRDEIYCGPPDVYSLLESLGQNTAYVNVRINGEVLSRRDFENISLRDGDRVDFLYFMGGGSCSIFPKLKSSAIPGT